MELNTYNMNILELHICVLLVEHYKYMYMSSLQNKCGRAWPSG